MSRLALGNGNVRGPLVETETVRVDRKLCDEISEEHALRESQAGIEISRGALIRQLIRLGLATAKRGRAPS